MGGTSNGAPVCIAGVTGQNGNDVVIFVDYCPGDSVKRRDVSDGEVAVPRANAPPSIFKIGEPGIFEQLLRRWARPRTGIGKRNESGGGGRDIVGVVRGFGGLRLCDVLPAAWVGHGVHIPLGALLLALARAIRAGFSASLARLAVWPSFCRIRMHLYLRQGGA